MSRLIPLHGPVPQDYTINFGRGRALGALTIRAVDINGDHGYEIHACETGTVHNDGTQPVTHGLRPSTNPAAAAAGLWQLHNNRPRQ